ncbi:MAG: hypothetical protein WAS05_09730 [Candidatus Nanopelagicales bacterium]
MTDQATPFSAVRSTSSVASTRSAGANSQISPSVEIALVGGAVQVRKASDLGEVADSLIPVTPQLKPLFPRGGLERGVTCSIRADLGAMSLLVNLLAYPLAQEKWVSMVGFSGCVPLAFEEACAGFELSESAGSLSSLLRRLVMVPSPVGDAGEVIGAAIESMDIVVINSSVLKLAPRVWSRLAAKLRSSGAALIVLGAAQGRAELECRVVEQRWFGLGRGQGRLRAQELQVRSRTKRDAQFRECVVEVGQHASYGIEMAR